MKIFIIIKMISISIIWSIKGYNVEECSLKYDETYIFKSSLIAKNVINFTELKFNCTIKNYLLIIRIECSNPLIIDNTLSMTNLKLNTYAVIFSFSNIKGIQLHSNPLDSILINIKIESFSQLQLEWTYFKFYSSFITEDSCLKNTTTNYKNILTSQFLTSLKLKRTVSFNGKVCPLVFNNSNINELIVDSIVDTLLSSNLLKFNILTHVKNKVKLAQISKFEFLRL